MGPKKVPFRGVATALVTPFKNGKPDMAAFDRLIDKQLAAGIDALVISGTTGEAATLTEHEQEKLLDFALRKIDGRVPVIAGCGANCTEKMIRMSENAQKTGCDGLLLVTPYYNKATPRGLIASFGAVADRVNLPIILYHVPSRTGLTVPPAVFAELSKRENIVGLKEASGSIAYLEDVMALCGENLAYYTGNDDLIHATVSLGGAGAISVLSNLLPAATCMLCRLSREGKNEKAAALQLFYLPLIRALFSEVNPIPVKTALHLMGLCEEEFRLPLCPIAPENREKLLTEMKNVGIV